MVVMLLLIIVATFFEGIGIGMLLPIVEFIQSDGNADKLAGSSKLWSYLVDGFRFFGIPVTLGVLIAVSFTAIILRQFMVFIRQMYNFRLAESLIYRNCNLAFTHYLNAETAYQEQTATGSVVNSVTTELRYAIDSIFIPINIANFIVNLIFYVCLLLFIAGPITVIALATIGGAAYAVKSYLAKSLKSGDSFAEANDRMTQFLIQRLKSPRLIRLSGAEEAERREMRRLTQDQRDNMINLRLYLAKIDALMEPMAIGIGFVTIYFGVDHFGLSLEQVGLFAVIAMMRLLPIAKETVRASQTILGYLGSLRGFERRLDEMSAAREHLGGENTFEGMKESLRFEDVTFEYRGDHVVSALRNIDLAIEAGQMIAVVGPSGAGKSTLVDLLPRLREPSEGRITIDGEALHGFSIESLRHGISYVSQSPLIFNVTVRDHIQYGRSEATDEEVKTAARLAGAAEFIDALPLEYETLVGEEGVMLSGGQCQRLDLARALIRNAPILVLDEPTSNLDAQSELNFKNAIARIREQTTATVIIVAHRLSTIADADKIVTLEGGRVTAVGSHDELMAANGWYAQAYRKQQTDEHMQTDGADLSFALN